MSLLAKIDYLVRRLDLAPSSILAISFTRKTVTELIESCPIAGVEFRTFHSLGKSLLDRARLSECAKLQLLDDDRISEFLRQKLRSLLKSDQLFAHDFVIYFYLYASSPYSPADFKDHATRISLHRNFLCSSLRSRLAKAYLCKSHDCSAKSIRQELIRSKEAQLLADFLFIHGLKYDYQIAIASIREKICPDFTVYDKAGHAHYLELRVLIRPGQSIYGSEYLRELRRHDRLYHKYHISCVKMYSFEWEQADFYALLSERLAADGLYLDDLDLASLTQLALSDSLADELTKVLKSLQSFLLHYKNAMLDTVFLDRLKQASDLGFRTQRQRYFLKIFCPLLQAYEDFLEESNSMDFADMINRAIRALRELPELARGYNYILLDEVQDLSKNRCCLIRAILDKNPACRLFAVGDDWQSIYRFAGSDLSLIQNFSECFGRHTRYSLIQTTHRFGLPTSRISSRYIQLNPAQSHKKVCPANKNQSTPIDIVISKKDTTRSDSQGFFLAMQKLLNCYSYQELQGFSLQVISRYNRDIRRLSDPLQFHFKGANVAEQFC